jgi:hypothetical protein
MMEPRRVHWVAAKHVLRYLQGTMDYGLDYVRCDGVRLIGCTDSDWAGSASDQKSTSDVVSHWARQLCHGSAGNKSQWH